MSNAPPILLFIVSHQGMTLVCRKIDCALRPSIPLMLDERQTFGTERVIRMPASPALILPQSSTAVQPRLCLSNCRLSTGSLNQC